MTKKASSKELRDIEARIAANRTAGIIPAPKRSHKKKVPIVANHLFLDGKEIGGVMTNPPTYHYAEANPTTHPATILYKKLPDDMILITGFENFKSIDDILDQYGRIVTTAYSAYPSHMSGLPGTMFLDGLFGFGAVRIGQVYNKKDFSTIIAHVKKCGCLLHDIIQAVEKGEVKRVEI